MANILKKKNNSENTTLDERRQRLKKSQEAILNKKTPFIIQEAYRTARTNIIFSLADSSEKCKVLCITSANAGEGKTTTALNLAITFAQTGSKVLLIDADLRKPRIHQYLGVVKSDGLTTVLSKQKEFEDVVYHNLRPGLDCMTSGSIPPNPAELLGSESMEKLLDKLKLQYDYILIDTPPVTVVTDAVALSGYVSGIMLIVREGFTNYESIDQALSLLNIAKAKLIGFFINDIDAMSMNYGSYRSGYGKGYKSKYDNGYGYGYSYSDRSSSKKIEKTTNNNRPEVSE
ncbi:MAG: polysaccharide biosynthesis tyrosine autokinase [Clostridiales bacterium]|nr:polysaccharide biosynthesis tyrosine autokinase [Clostridiales bacterium]